MNFDELTGKILFVDDEKQILNSIKRLFRKTRFEVIICDQPKEALMIIDKNPDLAAIISDQRMPEMDGAQFLTEARKRIPLASRLILTGYSDMDATLRSINDAHVHGFLSKPWEEQSLLETVSEAVLRYNAITENERLQKELKKSNEELKELNATLDERVKKRTEEVIKLNSELEQGFLHVVKSMGAMAAIHNDSWSSHSKTVANLVGEIGKRMSFGKSEIFQLKLAAYLHDIGEVGISKKIIQKPTIERTPEERKKFESHVIWGETLIEGIPNAPNVSRFIRHHHEKFDGSGFPDQLQEKEIPLESRIIAVVDTYDRFLNFETIGETSTPAGALQKIKDMTPEYFDPDVVFHLDSLLKETGEMETPDYEVELDLYQLREGYIIAHDLKTDSGVTLLGKGKILTKELLEKIRKRGQQDRITGRVSIFKRSIDSMRS
ncbi:MAG: hypothetical protein CL678_03970 [Bdellovibrionaceae bacterium]|nr:hypothetical protein [Pseudobdellovibrionaceae bacterium]|tara:strand:+ start:1821 stop:3128 length:1308 start_codon:yes stop_codon:yes gene_type:complete